jgi:hypothetical protein
VAARRPVIIALMVSAIFGFRMLPVATKGTAAVGTALQNKVVFPAANAN